MNSQVRKGFKRAARALIGKPAAPLDPFLRFAPPGHFYSPIPHRRDIDRENTSEARQIVALASGAAVAQAVRFANEAAGIVVSKFGPATTSATELLAAVTITAQADPRP